jgi:hypothetical protein
MPFRTTSPPLRRSPGTAAPACRFDWSHGRRGALARPLDDAEVPDGAWEPECRRVGSRRFLGDKFWAGGIAYRSARRPFAEAGADVVSGSLLMIARWGDAAPEPAVVGHSRRLCAAPNSAIAGGHDQAVDAAIATVG